jgi:hypothetical protein
MNDGFVLLARKMLDSDLMSQSPLVVKLWVWLLLKANWKDRNQLGRGQLVTTIAEMREAMSHFAGFRKIVPTADKIRTAYESLSKAARITVRKTTRGMVVTILNYNTYQDGKNYVSRTERHTENAMESSSAPHDTEEGSKQNKKPSFDEGFDEFWALYPRKTGKAAATTAWRKLHPPQSRVLETISWQIESDEWIKECGKYIPHPATWLNQGRWDDEPPIMTHSCNQGDFYI